jgi:hypothetical protein
VRFVVSPSLLLLLLISKRETEKLGHKPVTQSMESKSFVCFNASERIHMCVEMFQQNFLLLLLLV